MTFPPEREVAVFSAARRLPAGERAAFLDGACAGDAAFRQHIEQLLRASEEASDFLKSPAALASGLGGMVVPTGKPGDRIGRYKLLQQIGEGGCGVVYMAEQEEPVRRRVALKVIKLGMDTKSVIARFEAERQALALMDHPNIAKVLDAGATDTGRPYFVMELVRGTRITDYCDQNNLSTRERLDLFIQVCRAIQHAHQKGIIHRDIKPSNILVTVDDGVPTPKVIDFGIAKATQGKLTDHTVFTAFEQFIGTPAYMSPEQAEMNARDVDTRSDIYSLGVLLYELLTGQTPFNAKKLLQAGLDEIRRIIRQDEPARPSTCLSTMEGAELTDVAKNRKAEPPKLIHLLRGDLDWIVIKALEKDRTRRYETANGLAVDVQRHLDNEPVAARPPGNLYKFQKLVRRNKLAFIAAGAVTAALIIGLIVSTWMFIREKQARQEAEVARAEETLLRQKGENRERESQAELLYNSHNYEEAEKVVNEIPPSMIETDPLRASLLRRLGWQRAHQSQWKEAAADLAILVQIDGPVDGQFDWFGITVDPLAYGTTLVELGDTIGYESFRKRVLARYGNTTNSVAAGCICKYCLTLPAGDEAMRVLGGLYDVAARSQEDSALTDDKKNWACVSLAMVDYRRGNYPKAMEWCQHCLSSPQMSFSSLQMSPLAPTAHVILAMACHQLHRETEARLELAQGRETVEKAFQTPEGTGSASSISASSMSIFDWLYARILLREATSLLEVQPTADTR